MDIKMEHAVVCKALFDGRPPYEYGDNYLKKYYLEAEKFGLIQDGKLTENGKLFAQQCIGIPSGPISYTYDRKPYDLAIGKYLTLIRG